MVVLGLNWSKVTAYIQLSFPIMDYFKTLIILICISILLTACGRDENPINIPVSGNSAHSSSVRAQDHLSKYYIIAHRGYWDSENPPNSLASLERALLLDIYGTEMDIRQTIDGIIVVNHEAEYCGLSIASSTYEELCQYTLSNGEVLPLFENFLKLKKNIGGPVKLVLDLKDCDVVAMVSLIDSYGLQAEVDYISSSFRLCNQLVTLGYGHKTFYLIGNVSPADIKDRGYGGIDYSDSSYSLNPGWINEAQELGLETIVWTVDNKDRIKYYVQQGVLVTTDKPVEASAVCNNLKGDETCIYQVTTN